MLLTVLFRIKNKQAENYYKRALYFTPIWINQKKISSGFSFPHIGF